jgi:hypothetical protein
MMICNDLRSKKPGENQTMNPHETAKMIHQELSPFAPKLSAALNRALLDIGEGSVLVGLGPGANQNDDVTFQETESIALAGDEPATVLLKIQQVLWAMEENSSWRVLVDKKPGISQGKMELLYTLFRSPRCAS